MALIRVEKLAKYFGDNRVLQDISFTGEPKEVISILGKSGSGKSTLLRCLNLLETPSAGSLHLMGEALDFNSQFKNKAVPRLALRKIRTQMGMVFQQFNLWAHMTVLQNVAEAPMQVKGLSREEAEAKAKQYLELVGLSDKLDSYPSRLSGGQQQRAAIARALAMEPAVLLFDEPTSALDPELVGEVLTVIRELAKSGRTMIVVTHEIRFARDVSTKIVFLEHGKVEATGTPSELFNESKSPRFTHYVSSQLNV
jgi:ABC-type histidine transport system ATPase subunit